MSSTPLSYSTPPFVKQKWILQRTTCFAKPTTPALNQLNPTSEISPYLKNTPQVPRNWDNTLSVKTITIQSPYGLAPIEDLEKIEELDSPKTPNGSFLYPFDLEEIFNAPRRNSGNYRKLPVPLTELQQKAKSVYYAFCEPESIEEEEFKGTFESDYSEFVSPSYKGDPNFFDSDESIEYVCVEKYDFNAHFSP